MTKKNQIEILKAELNLRKSLLNIAEKALNDILKWQDDVDSDWDYPETIAAKAIEKMLKIQGF